MFGSSLTPGTNSTDSLSADYTFDYGNEYMYPGYTFERPVYLYLWEILVILMVLQNLIILIIFLQRKMRSPTNMILCSMAISDSLTGLVTLPTYIMVFQKFDPKEGYDYDYDYHFPSYQNTSSLNQTSDGYDFSVTQSFLTTKVLYYNGSTSLYDVQTHPPVDGYILTKGLCRGFMISKYFLSKSFHTVSIFLTLFLEIQKYVAMAYPYWYDTCFNRFRIVKVYCISAFVICPFLHSYHLWNEKSVRGLCQWEITGSGCSKDCVYLWIAFVVTHFIPCVTLVIFTGLFIRELKRGEKQFRQTGSTSSQYLRRVQENRRISVVVTVVVIVRLIPEIPYSIFLLHNSLKLTLNDGRSLDLETNRIFHMCYEICLVSSFLANFYIYIIINKSFRRRLYQTIIEPVRRKTGIDWKFNKFKCSSFTRDVMNARSSSVKPENEYEMNRIHSGIPDEISKNNK